MSIQLLVMPVQKLFGPSLRCRDDAERQENLARFQCQVNERCKSHVVSFKAAKEEKSEFFDFFISEVELLFDVVEREFPELRDTMESYIYIPVSDSNERFHFEFPLICEGEESTWAVSDTNSLKDLIARLVEFNETQQTYNRELLASALRNYAEAIPVAERRRFLIFYSH
ncbi:MAG: hypothetical protein IT365_08635 [Candidatus Hydrogenedentes bacterium]|nr:hypothetical protein [Candidatus Hydrogenedentota bacterium]